MDDFEKLVERARSKRENRMISNASIAHAEILLRAIFVTAIEDRTTVKISTGELHAAFYGKLFKEARQLLDSGGMIDVVVENPDQLTSDNAFLNLVASHENGRVFALAEEMRGRVSHFALTGDRCYRLETDHEAREAIANFGDKELAEMLHGVFDLLLEISDPLRRENIPTPERVPA